MATLKVTITESVTINGKDMGGTYSGFSNASITQVEKRIVNATTTETTLYDAANATADVEDNIEGGAAWDDDSVKYVRITNLDTDATKSVILVLANSDNDEFLYKLYGMQSFLLWNHNGAFHAYEGGATAIGNVQSITKVTVQAISATQAVELFIGSTDAA